MEILFDSLRTCTGIFKQSMGSRNRVVGLARQATQPDGISSLESILGPLESLKFGLCLTYGAIDT